MKKRLGHGHEIHGMELPVFSARLECLRTYSDSAPNLSTVPNIDSGPKLDLASNPDVSPNSDASDGTNEESTVSGCFKGSPNLSEG